MAKSPKEIILMQAKAKLYSALLDMDNDYLCKNEVELMFCLSKDIDIQEILEKAMKKEKK